jgi:hypothetical protein
MSFVISYVTGDCNFCEGFNMLEVWIWIKRICDVKVYVKHHRMYVNSIVISITFFIDTGTHERLLKNVVSFCNTLPVYNVSVITLYKRSIYILFKVFLFAAI